MSKFIMCDVKEGTSNYLLLIISIIKKYGIDFDMFGRCNFLVCARRLFFLIKRAITLQFNLFKKKLKKIQKKMHCLCYFTKLLFN